MAWDSPIRANVKVKKVFWQIDTDLEDNEIKTLMVTYSPGTEGHLTEITSKVDYLRPMVTPKGVKNPVDDPHSAVGTMKRVSWEAIKPHVDAFLSGETVKVYGVPLEEWTDVNESRRGVFQQYGIRSVEEIVNAPESIVIRMSPVMPDVRRWQEKAAKYLADCAEGKTRAVIAERDDRINTLESQLSEMREMMQQLLGAKIAEASGEPEKRRGRPPKIPIDQPVEDAAAA